jgi:hypothetical protein
MQDFLKKNGIILLAFLLPIVVIAGVALSVYLPSAFLKTDYDFVYISCSNINGTVRDCSQAFQRKYDVQHQHIAIREIGIAQDFNSDNIPDRHQLSSDRIFYHDTKKNESYEISFDDAKKLVLNDLITSPDGVTVSGNYSRSGGDFFPFGGGSSSYGYYLTKGKARSKLNLINTTDQYYYQNNFQFIGWVLKK